MFVTFFLCYLLCVSLKSDVLSAEKIDFDKSSEESIFEKFGSGQEPFHLIGKMIDEARAIIMGILRGDLSDDIKKQIEKQNVDLNGSYDGVSKLVKTCLRKAKNKEEGKEIVKKCFEKAIRERQAEELEEAPQTIKSCIQESMFDASQSAAPLMMLAQKQADLFREMVKKATSDLGNCREEEKPFQCTMAVWAEAGQNMTSMRDQVIDMMLMARDIYIEFMDNVKKCITPVEAPDEGVEEEEGNEREKTKKYSTPANPPANPTQAYYDPVEEARKKTFSPFPPL